MHALRRKDGHIVPAAIELWHAVDGSADGKTAVYTRDNCDPKARRPCLPCAGLHALGLTAAAPCAPRFTRTQVKMHRQHEQAVREALRRWGSSPTACLLFATVAPDNRLTAGTACAQVWLVAKAVFASLDSGIHQLVSHLLRTHVCQEPYILATDRCLSTMHPVRLHLPSVLPTVVRPT